MKVVLVDNENSALISLNKLLSASNDVEVIGAFTQIGPAIELILQNQPETVFMDIEMSEMSGLAAATVIRSISPRTEIIFVTAHRQYATDAFNLEAFDYLLKPVKKERLSKTLVRLRKRGYLEPAKPRQPYIYLRCMGRMLVHVTGQEPRALKWRTTKVKELFAYLLHSRNQIISKDKLIELLWPDVDEQKGTSNLQTSIYRIRRLIEDQGLEQWINIRYLEFGYILETNQLIIDAEELDVKFRQLMPISPNHLTEHQQLFEAYNGDYMGEDQYFWAETERLRLRTMWLQHAHNLAAYYLEQGRELEALTVYHRILRLDPTLEEGHVALMRIYDRLNDRNSVEQQYALMTTILKREADVEPSAETMEWYQNWQQKR
ncbi:response regulator [Paenibacillus agaridevorans]|uniref:response regulator n=1 Tax=Paenibacillus agaridevorans TaxID=171404 RepID=UPI001BE42D35|nr:response regulator [Paenibacillus agaridevorans]